MNQTYKNDRPVRFPLQIRPTPKPMERQDHPIVDQVRNLCGVYNLSATFSEDTAAHTTLKTPGLIAVQCVLRKDDRAIGIGHGTAIISRLNRANERTLFSCFNGALMSAVNSACKTLDVLRLDTADDGARVSFEPATEKQRQYLMQLASINLDESEAEQFVASIEGMTRQEASEAIQRFVR